MCGIVCCMAGMLLTACDMFEYHPYSIDINGRTNIHAENVERIEQLCKGRDVVRFAFVTDTQGCVDELEDAVADIRRRDDIDFIIHGGDQTDFAEGSGLPAAGGHFQAGADLCGNFGALRPGKIF